MEESLKSLIVLVLLIRWFEEGEKITWHFVE